MFALTQSAAVAPARVVAKAPKATKAKAAFTVRAAKEESATRRAALVGLTAAAAAAVVHSAQAIVIFSPRRPALASAARTGRRRPDPTPACPGTPSPAPPRAATPLR